MLDLFPAMDLFPFTMLLLVPIFYMLFHQSFLMFPSVSMLVTKVSFPLNSLSHEIFSNFILGSIRARKLNILTLKDVEKIPYPLELEPVAKTPYFAKVISIQASKSNMDCFFLARTILDF